MPDGSQDAERAARIGALYALFNEVGIIEQLSRTLFEAKLPDGVTVPHFGVLSHLHRVRDGQTPLRLARAFQVPKTSMTNTLAGLERRGLVEMRPNPGDGRSKCVWLTLQGRAFYGDAIASLTPDLERLDAALDGERLAALVPELSRLREWLDADRD